MMFHSEIINRIIATTSEHRHGQQDSVVKKNKKKSTRPSLRVIMEQSDHVGSRDLEAWKDIPENMPLHEQKQR